MFRRHLIIAAAAAIVTPMVLSSQNVILPGQNIAYADQHQDQQDQKKMDEMFFKAAASGNTLEIRAAKLAEQRVDDAQVKQVAQMMERDHSQANDLLEKFAKQEDISVSTDDLNKIDQATLDALDKMQGNEFLHMYVFIMTGAHVKDQLIYSFHTTHGSPEVREYATQVLPKIDEHLHALEAIARPMAGLNEENAEPAAAHMNDQH